MVPYSTLLQNVTDYYKMKQLFYYKIQQKFIAKCVRFFITKCDSLITNCDSTLMLFVHKKNYQEIIKINITKRFS